jgi:hypothetical protein
MTIPKGLTRKHPPKKSRIADLDLNTLEPTHVHCDECMAPTPIKRTAMEQVYGHPRLFASDIVCGDCERPLLTVYCDLGDS